MRLHAHRRLYCSVQGIVRTELDVTFANVSVGDVVTRRFSVSFKAQGSSDQGATITTVVAVIVIVVFPLLLFLLILVFLLLPFPCVQTHSLGDQDIFLAGQCCSRCSPC